MMYWYGHGMGWAWGWGLMTFAFWALVVVAVVLLIRHFSRSGGHRPPGPHAYGPPPPDAPHTSAEQLLAERYARGEIDDEEYRRRLATLRGEAPAAPGPDAEAGRK